MAESKLPKLSLVAPTAGPMSALPLTMQRLPAAVVALVLALALTLALAACSEDRAGDDLAGDERAGVDVDAGEAPATTLGSAPSEPSAGSPPLPGERVAIFPYAGARLAVVGVAAGDTLHVRAGPGVEFEVLFDLAPLATNARATGHNRSVGRGPFWSEINVDGRTGWANSRFLLQPGQVSDITANLFPTPADRPIGKTLFEVGQTVARLRASKEPPSNIVVVDGPTVRDLGEITVDVIGLGDDAQGGERLKIFAEQDPAGGRFTVRTVESTQLCSRGVSNDGFCA